MSTVVSTGTQQTQLTVFAESLLPMIADSIYLSRVAHQEVVIRIINEEGRGRIQIKREESSITWLSLASMKHHNLTTIPITKEDSTIRAKSVVRAIRSDIFRLFETNREPGNMELTLKFRDGGLASAHITHYKQYRECRFPSGNVHKS